MNDPQASVIVPCYRHARPLRCCLEGLSSARQGDRFETIVVDSGSDGTVGSAAAGLSGVRVVSTPKRLWPGAARNLGARAARGEFLLFLDADCVPEPGWVQAACVALEAGARMAGGPVLDLIPHHPIAASDNLLQFAECPPDRPEGPAARFPSCNFAIRRSDFDTLGGFAEHLRAGEDVGFSRAASSRWPQGLRFVPRMRVRHLGRTQLRRYLAHQAWFGYSRGVLGNDLRPMQRRLAAHAIMLPGVVLKRLSYILGRTAAWHPRGLLRALALSPLLMVGLCAYAVGLRRGLRGAPEPEEPW